MKKFKTFMFYIKNYKFNSILVKTFLIILVLLLIPLSALIGIMYSNMTETFKNEITLMNKNAAYRVRDTIDNVFKDVGQMAVFLSLHKNTRTYLLSPKNDPLLEDQDKELIETLDICTAVYDYLDSIYIYSDLHKKILSNDVDIDTTWYDQFIETRGKGIWVDSRKRNNIYPYLITYIQPANQNYFDGWLGSVIININIEGLTKLVRKNANTDFENMLIIDQNGKILYSYDRDLFSENIENIKLYNYIDGLELETSNIVDMNGKKYAIATVKSNMQNWTYISLQPLHHYEKQVQTQLNYMFLLLAICIGIAFVIAVYITMKTFNPVIEILSMFEHPNQFSASDNNKHKQDEINLMAEKIMRIILTNNQLKEEMETRLKSLNKAQMIALQAQMNPHFLYNTLETIRWLVVELTNSENKPSIMIKNLSTLLRLSLDASDELITISDEIEYTQSYIDIMKVRYEEKLSIVWNINDEILEERTVRLVLQPLVENAIYHGVKKKKSASAISITGKIENNDILLMVSDNGVGMEQDRIDEMNSVLKENKVINCEHIGIYNVNQRIKLVFGERYGVRLFSREDEGLSVEIRIPQQLETLL